MERETVYSSQDSYSGQIHVLTLNCWGLKFISKYRSERLSEIGNRLATYSPPLDIIGLQECWTYSDYRAVRESTRQILPYAKFYHSGIFGGGLAIYSRWPIEETSMFRYPLNGRPTAFFRGDWFVGKGVAHASIRMPDAQVIEVFNTHLHAPYEREPNDSYICHRTAQAWEIAKLMKAASQRGSLVLGLGDFNMIPMSFAHMLIESRGNVRDVWRVLKPASSIGASIDTVEAERRQKVGEKPCPDANESLRDHGHTCDSVLNTWRWEKAEQRALNRGRDRQIALTEPDPKAKRLDYIFFGGLDRGWSVHNAQVCLTERHPDLLCSLSDHFAVEATIVQSGIPRPSSRILEPGGIRQIHNERPDMLSLTDEEFKMAVSVQPTSFHLGPEFYEDILEMIRVYTLRERKQRRYRVGHFLGSALISIGCFIAVWWSPRNFVAFLLMLLSSLGLMAGTVDGLIGGLFVGSELRALAEFDWEVRNVLQNIGGPIQQDKSLRDWYDENPAIVDGRRTF